MKNRVGWNGKTLSTEKNEKKERKEERTKKEKRKSKGKRGRKRSRDRVIEKKIKRNGTFYSCVT